MNALVILQEFIYFILLFLVNSVPYYIKGSLTVKLYLPLRV